VREGAGPGPLTVSVVGITGNSGLIGWHLRCRLGIRRDIEVACAGRDEFAAPERLETFASRCDAIVHLAGANRGPDEQVYATNVALTESLIQACERADVRPHTVFASSTHIRRGTAYGRSKVACADRLRDWSTRTGAPLSVLVLPNVFGEHARPFHNSVVATFCHQLAHGEMPQIEVDATYEYLHSGEVTRGIEEALEVPGEHRELSGTPLAVSEILERLREFDDHYRRRGVIPTFGDEVSLALFNTYRSYLFPAHYPVRLELRSDQRGALVEAVKTREGGQAFLSTTRPGITRGNHFHFRKVERFLVVSGRATIRIRRLHADDTHAFDVSGDDPCYIDMPTLHAHNITNVGDGDLITLFWANEIFDPDRPDTYAAPV
jgi:UDP-2-acetamido-2,6-beta-L-arabino-hexul-4-ose reductase